MLTFPRPRRRPFYENEIKRAIKFSPHYEDRRMTKRKEKTSPTSDQRKIFPGGGVKEDRGCGLQFALFVLAFLGSVRLSNLIQLPFS